MNVEDTTSQQRTAEAFEAVDWLHQQTWLHCGRLKKTGSVFVKVRT